MVFADLHIHSKEFIGRVGAGYFQHDIGGISSLEQLMQVMQEHSDGGMISRQGSDGLLTTVEILKLAQERGIGAVSIVDHWNMKAIPFTMIWALENNSPLYISGMECKPDYLNVDKRIKLPNGAEFLAYYFNPEDKRLGDFVNHWMYNDLIKKAKWLDVLRDAFGEKIPSFEKCLSERDFGRNPLANKRFLFDYLRSRDAIELDYRNFQSLIQNIQGSETFSFAEFAALVHGAGGIVGIAHPLRWEDFSMVKRALETGLCDFVETNYDYDVYLVRKPWRREAVEEGMPKLPGLVNKYGVPISGGSDEHDSTLIGSIGVTREQLRMLAGTALARYGKEKLLSEGRVNESLSKIIRPLILERDGKYLVIQKRVSSYSGNWTFPEKVKTDGNTDEEKLILTMKEHLGLTLDENKLGKIPDYAPNTNGPIICFNVPFFYKLGNMDIKQGEGGTYATADWMTLRELRSLPNLHPEARPVLQIIENLQTGIYGGI